MSSRFFFSGAARRALRGFSYSSPFVSKCSAVPSSNLISFDPSWRLPPPPAVTASITTAPVRFFSASERVGVLADEHLKRVIGAQIRRGEEELDTEFFIPKDFPFEIVDNSGEEMITLRRNYSRENMEVEVLLPDWLLNKEEEKKKEEEYFCLTIKIDKGGNTYLEFDAHLLSKSIAIYEMHLKSHQVLEDTQKYEGPGIGDLEGTLYRAAVKYLKARGIDGSLLEFLKKYMMNKNDRENLDWLKKIRDFLTM